MKSHRSTIFTSPLSCHTSPSRILPCTPLLSSSHFAHRNVDNDNSVISFSTNDCLGLDDEGHKRLDRNTAVGRKGGN
jgi:hypothetical protein